MLQLRWGVQANPYTTRLCGYSAFGLLLISLTLQLQVRLKQEHLNIAKFEPEHGLDPMLDLVLVGSEWQFRIQSRARNWQDKLVVTSTGSVEQDAISPTEVYRFILAGLFSSLCCMK